MLDPVLVLFLVIQKKEAKLVSTIFIGEIVKIVI